MVAPTTTPHVHACHGLVLQVCLTCSSGAHSLPWHSMPSQQQHLYPPTALLSLGYAAFLVGAAVVSMDAIQQNVPNRAHVVTGIHVALACLVWVVCTPPSRIQPHRTPQSAGVIRGATLYHHHSSNHVLWGSHGSMGPAHRMDRNATRSTCAASGTIDTTSSWMKCNLFPQLILSSATNQL